MSFRIIAGAGIVSLLMSGAAQASPYVAGIDVRPGAPREAAMVSGQVFHDRNGNGILDDRERGVRGVMVSNGRDVVKTARDGSYVLPVRDDMSVFVIQPSGWRVPTDDRFIPQFAYQHKPSGSPKPLRYGGLPPTGPLPSAINFPLQRSDVGEDFTCAVLGDVQTYSNDDVGHARDSVVDDLLDRGPARTDCLLAVGDVLGDDMELLPRLAEILGAVQAPQWWVHGNHDFDFDADFDENSADTWRRMWGPEYYAFEMGDVLFIVLDNVVYPCTAEDNTGGGREHCVTGTTKRYNGRITHTQMTFVRNLLAVADADRKLVFAHHIPFVSFQDQTMAAHQTDNVNELYELVGDRPALSLSGHTHTIENFAPGDAFEGWKGVVGVAALPFRHVIAGAVSGAWYNGDWDVHGVPMSLQRQGAPRGFLDLSFEGTDYTMEYIATGLGADRAMWLSLNTPPYRQWFDTLMAWRAEDRATRTTVPPLSVQDLPDVKILTPEDLSGTTWLTANVWMGDTTTDVTVSLNGGTPVVMTRTQSASGEAARIGAEWSDPFATQRQLTVSRVAIQSRSGNEDAQGYAQGRWAKFAPGPPQPLGAVADRNLHLWRFELPTDLNEGVHVAEITATRDHGRTVTDRIVFEVRRERPERLWRAARWDQFEDGPPVR